MIALWPVDSLTKVFQDDPVPRYRERAIDLFVARGAVESAQCAFQSDKDLTGFEVMIDPPRLRSNRKLCLGDIKWRRVEYVPVRRPSWYLDPTQRLRNTAGFFPDPLINPENFPKFYSPPAAHPGLLPLVTGHSTIPLWLTLSIPEKAVPGLYTGSLTIKTPQSSRSIKLNVEVSPAICPQERTLKLTHWFSPQNIAKAGKVKLWSPQHWKLLSHWGRDLALHRANVIFTPLSDLLHLTKKGNRLRIDFSRFDKWVRTFQQAGAIGYIEGTHLASRINNWQSQYGLNPFIIHKEGGKTENLNKCPAQNPRCRAFLKDFLAQLSAHLREKNWDSFYYQHVADEPIPENTASYRALTDMVREFAPGLPILDALLGSEALAGTVNIWCPQSQEAEKHLEFFHSRQALGEEIWHYTCCSPSQKFPNRFLNQPLLGTRLLHWFNHKAGLTGYLHWGFNFWVSGGFPDANPFTDTETTETYGTTRLPAGDSHLVYPDPDGKPLDSIRHEMVLEGVQDYELLQVLSRNDPDKAMRLAKAVLPTLVEYEKKPAVFRKIRAELLAGVARAQG